MANAEYIEKDQYWNQEKTRYWFLLTGTDYGTGWEFDGSLYAVVDSGSETKIIDDNGCPLTEGGPEWIAVNNTARVTDVERFD